MVASADFDPKAAQFSVSLRSTPDGVLIPGGDWLLTAQFSRVGSDLVLTGADGDKVLVADYFSSDSPPPLLTETGAQLGGALVDTLAGPRAPLQFAEAQLAQASDASGAIGKVLEVVDSVQVTHASGAQATLAAGDAVFLGDVIQAGPAGQVSIEFVDGTTFALAEGARMTLDELVFNPGGSGNSFSASVLQGTFVFFTGQIAPNGSMEVTTPVGTIGVRGTTVAGRLGLEGSESVFTLLPDADGHVGVVEITNGAGSRILDQAYATTRVTSFFIQPGPVTILSEGDALQLFDDALQDLRRRRGESPANQDQGGSTGDGGATNAASLSEEQLDQAAQSLGEFETAAGPLGFVQLPSMFITPPGAPIPAAFIMPSFFTLDAAGVIQLTSSSFSSDSGPSEDLQPADTRDQDADLPPPAPPPPPPSPFTIISGGSGNDALSPGGGSGRFQISGNAGDDALVGGDLDDILDGGDGNDVLDAGPGNDVVQGGAGDDLIIGGSGQGDDAIDGGGDNDTVIYDSADQNITVNLTTGQAFGDPDIGFDSLTGIENVISGSGNDTVTGNEVANLLVGGLGNDSISGVDGNDVLVGDAGNDTLTGGTGDDFLDGGGGTDVAVFSGNQADYTVALVSGVLVLTDTRPGGDGTDILENIEIVSFADKDVSADSLGNPNLAPTAILLSNKTVAENATGAVIGNVTVVDPNAGDSHVFTVSDSRFEIVGGQLVLAPGKSLDFEAGPSIQIQVTATDTGGLSKVQDFTITVTNVDEPPSAPVDDNAAPNTVAHNAAPGTPVGIDVSSIDPDGGPVNFALIDASGLFQIDPLTGFVTTGASPLVAGSYNVTIVATDAGENANSANFTITVTNQAPSAPVDNDAALNTVLHNAAPGTPVGLDVSSIDPEGGAVTFGLVDTSGLFQIHPVTGVVTTGAAPLVVGLYDVTIVATDPGGLTNSANFTINVTNGAPSAPVDNDAALNTVPHNAAPNTPVGIDVSSIDPEGGGVTFGLIDTSGLFQIDPVTGIVTTGAAPLVSGSYDVTIVATDTAGQSSNANFTINVTNQPPSAPVDNDVTLNTVAHNVSPGTLVGIDVSSIDPEGGAVTFGLIDTSGLFQIDPVTGLVTTGAAPLAAGSYDVTITATDTGGQSNSSVFAITVTNQAPSAPVDDDDSPNTIPHNVAAGTAVGIDVSSIDPEGGAVTFSLIDTSGLFQIDPVTGIVTTGAAPLVAGSYDVTIVATDSGGLSNSANFTINVTNEVPSAPVDDDDSPNTVPHNVAAGTAVGIDVSSIDPEGGAVTFSLQDTSGLFQIDPVTGIVTTGAAPLVAGSYDVTITATDAGGLTNSADFAIDVTNQAPSVPVDDDDSPSTIPHNVVAGTAVGIDVSSIDPEGGAVTFSLQDTSGLFQIDPVTGIVTTGAAPLVAGSYDVTITATDAGGLTNSAIFSIDVTNEAPSAPVDDDDSPNTIPHNVAAGTAVGINVSSIDPEGGAVTFGLIDTSGLFQIDPVTGIVTTGIAPLVAGPYDVTITATDAGGLTNSAMFSIDVTNQAPSAPVDDDDSPNTVASNVAAGTSVGIDVSSIDPEGGAVTFSLEDTSGLFQIDPVTGVVTTATTPLIAGSYDVTVFATDAGGLSSSAGFAIEVTETLPTAPAIDLDANDDSGVAGTGFLAIFTEGGAAVPIADADALITDSDDTNLEQLTVQLQPNPDGAFEQLSLTAGGQSLAVELGLSVIGSGTASLTIVGTASVPQYQFLLAQVVYENLSDTPTLGDHFVQVQAYDGTNLSNVATATVVVIPDTSNPPAIDLDANDSSGAPGAAYFATFTEGGVAVHIADVDALITDPDDINLEFLTVQVQPNPDGVFEQLSLTEAGQTLADNLGLSVLGSGTAALVISGTASVADYQVLLREVLYENLSNTPTAGAHQVQVVAFDGTDVSNLATAAINVIPDNAGQPAIDLDADDSSGVVGTGYAAIFNEGEAAVLIADGDALITDPDSTNLEQLSIQVQPNPDTASEQLSLTEVGQTLAANLGLSVAGSGTAGLIISGTATVADYQALLKEVLYLNLSDTPTGGVHQIEVQTYDGTNLSNVATTTVVVVPDLADQPVVDLDANDSSDVVGTGYATVFNEGGAAVHIADSDAVITDPDDVNLEQLTVQVQPNPDGGFEELSLTEAGQTLAVNLGLNVFGNGTAGLVIGGTATVADYQALLREVVYQNLSDTPTAGVHQVQVVAFDGTGFSDVATAAVNVIPDDADQPVIDLDANDSSEVVGTGYATTFNEGGAAVHIADSDALITDPDDVNLEQLTVQVQPNPDGGFEELSLTEAGQTLAVNLGLNVFGNGTAGLVIGGTATVADYQALLREVVYQNLSDTPTAGVHQVQVVAFDGTGFSDVSTAAINVVPDDADQPVIDLDANDSSEVVGTGYATTFNEGGAAVHIADSDALITDPDDTNLEQLTVQVQPNPDGGFEELSLTEAGQTLAVNLGLNVFGNGTAGLVISGTAAVADYQALLRDVVYQNLSDTPTGGAHLVQVQTYDGTSFSNTATSAINVVPDDADQPAIDLDANDSSGVEGTGYQTTFVEGGAAVHISDIDALITDPDDVNLEQLTVQVQPNLDGAFEQLSLTAAGQTLADNLGMNVFGNGTAGLVISGTATVADYQALLREVVYQNLSDAPTAGVHEVQVQTYDGTSFSDVATAAVTVVPTDTGGAPVLVASTLTTAKGSSDLVHETELKVTDTDTAPSQLFYTLTALPVLGALFLNNVELQIGETFTQEDIADGNLQYASLGLAGPESFKVNITDGTTTLSDQVITVNIVESGSIPDGDVDPGSAPLIAGDTGFGRLNILGGTVQSAPEGAVVGNTSTGSGFIWVTDPGSALVAGSDGIVVGKDGSGILLLTSEAVVETTHIVLGQNVTGGGNLTVEDSEVHVKGIDNSIIVGQHGGGILQVNSKSLVTALQLIVGDEASGFGQVTIEGLPLQTPRVVISNDDGLFSSPNEGNAGQVIVGNSGTGSLSVLESGVLEIRSGESPNTGTTNPMLLIGLNAGSTGNVLVKGDDAIVELQSASVADPGDVSDLLRGPGIAVGLKGTGAMTVTDQGTVILDGDEAFISVGVGNYLDPQDTSEYPLANLAVTNGGQIVLIDSPSGEGGLIVGDFQGGNGKVTVEGIGSLLSIASQGGARIGREGEGALTVASGGQVVVGSDSFNNLVIGEAATGVGKVTVTGSESTLTTIGTDNTIQLGQADGSSGLLEVKDGAVVSTLELDIGVAGTGQVDIIGATVTVSNDNGVFSDPFAWEGGFASLGTFEGGDGILNVLGGGTLEIRNGVLNPGALEPGLVVSRAIYSTGVVTVDGVGSSIQISQTAPTEPQNERFGPFLQVGRVGQATMTISNTALVSLVGDGSFVQVGRGDANEPAAVPPQSLLEIKTGGDLLIDGETDSGGMNLGQALNGNGKVVVDGVGSTLTITGASADLAVGRDGKGELLITGGGTVTVAAGNSTGESSFMIVGRSAGSTGLVTVSGVGGVNQPSTLSVTGTDAQISVGGNGEDDKLDDGGTGTLLVNDGAVVNTVFLAVGRDGMGTVTISNGGTVLLSNEFGSQTDDEGLTLLDDGGFVRVGRNAGGNGTLNVVNGGVLSITGTSTADDAGLQIARNVDSIGTVLVDGAGSIISIVQDPDVVPDAQEGEGGPFLTVGISGQADMTIRNDALVMLSGQDAFVQVGRGNEGGFDDPAPLPELSPQSLLTIELGGDLVVNGLTGFGGMNIGQQANGNGKVVVTGSGSSMDISGVSANVTVGSAGVGELVVADGATVTLAGTVNTGMSIGGWNTNSNGQVVVSGPGSRLSIQQSAPPQYSFQGAFIALSGGQALLKVENGGDITIEGPGANLSVGGPSGTSGQLEVLSGATLAVDGKDGEAALFVGGWEAGSPGSVLISGAGSSITITAGTDATMHIGEGTLKIADKGQFAISGAYASIDIGGSPGNDAQVEVTGVQSSLAMTGDDSRMNIGFWGAGSLAIKDGGLVKVLALDIGYANTGNAVVTVDGPGSALIVSNDSGVLHDNAAGSLSLHGNATLEVLAGGLVEVRAGTQNPDAIHPGLDFFGASPTDNVLVKVTGPGSLIHISQTANSGGAFSGGGAALSLYAGQALVTVEQSGKIVIDGPGSSAHVGGGTQVSSYVPTLEVTTGGRVEIYSNAEGAALLVAGGPGSAGAVVITESGSLAVKGDTYAVVHVGYGGDGLLAVRSTGVLTAGVSGDAVGVDTVVFENVDVQIFSHGTLDGGGGKIEGDVFIDQGTLLSGSSTVEQMNIVGDLVVGSGTLGVDASANAQSDRIVVQGDVNIWAATFEFNFLGNYVPQNGNGFILIQATSINIDLSNIQYILHGLSANGTFGFNVAADENFLTFLATANFSASDGLLYRGSESADTFAATVNGDELSGLGGNDTLFGGDGNDLILGGEGDDALDGGAGEDQLDGGGGSDTFAYQLPTDGGGAGDQISNFNADFDKFTFNLEGFNVAGIGAFNVSIIQDPYDGSNGTSIDYGTKDPSFIVDGGNQLIYDTNGSNAGYTVLATVDVSSGQIDTGNLQAAA